MPFPQIPPSASVGISFEGGAMAKVSDVLICKTCGAVLKPVGDAKTARCEYCFNEWDIVREEALTEKQIENAARAGVEKGVEAKRGLAVDAAVNAFLASDLRTAMSSAGEVHAKTADCPEAEFILGFCAYVGQSASTAGMDRFFTKFHPSELTDAQKSNLRRMFLKFPRNLAGYELQTVRFVREMSGGDAKALCDFVDAFSPYIIKKRESARFLDREMCDFYRELAGECSIPKTCYALVGAMKTLPESPFAGDSFGLRTRAQNFRRDFMNPVGDIVSGIRDSARREQLTGMYRETVSEFERRLR